MPPRSNEQLMAVYDLHGSGMYALASRILGEGSSAEEVVEATFCSWAQEERHGNASAGSEAITLMAMTRTQALACLRMRGRQPTGEASRPDHGSRSAAVTIDADRTILPSPGTAALEALTVEQRRVIELVYFEGLSLVELAQRLHQPVAEAGRCLRASLVRLRQVMLSPHHAHADDARPSPNQNRVPSLALSVAPTVALSNRAVPTRWP